MEIIWIYSIVCSSSDVNLIGRLTELGFCFPLSRIEIVFKAIATFFWAFFVPAFSGQIK